MAGDWMMMRLDLHEDPAVISMAEQLNINEDEVVGKLAKVWRWANRQSRDGRAVGATPVWLDRYIGMTGFAAAMIQVGWLVAFDGGLEIPKFDRFNSDSAKARAQNTKRQTLRRSKSQMPPEQERDNDATNVAPLSRFDSDKSATKEEKRIEEKKKDPPLPPQVADRGKSDNSPGWLARIWCAGYRGSYPNNNDAAKVSATFSEWIRSGLFKAENLRAEIDAERDRSESLETFKKRLTEAKHGRPGQSVGQHSRVRNDESEAERRIAARTIRCGEGPSAAGTKAGAPAKSQAGG